MLKSKSYWLWAFLIFFGILAMGQLERVELESFPAFYVHDAVLVGFVGWMGMKREWRVWLRGKLQVFPRLGWVGLGWAGVGLSLAAISGLSITYSLLTFARLTLYVLAACAVTYQLKQRQFNPQLIRVGLIFFFVALAVFGLAQYIFLPDTRFLFFLGWDDHYYRLISTIFDPGFTGILLALGYLFLQETLPKVSQKLRLPLTIASLVIVTALLFTYSRASYLAFGVILFFLFIKDLTSSTKRAALFPILTGTIFLAALFFLPRPASEGVKLERTSTIDARVINLQETVGSIKTPIDLILGHGLFVPTQSIDASIYSDSKSHARVPDNWIAMILSGTGVIGLGLCMAVLIKVLRWAVAQPHSYLWIALAAVLVHGLFNASVIYPFVWIVLLSWGVLTVKRQ